MNTALTPVELRAMRALADRYSEAFLDLVAREEAAETAAKPSPDSVPAARFSSLMNDPEYRAQLADYLDRLEVTHGNDRWMRPVIDEGRARLAAYADDPEHPYSAPDGDPATTPDGPDHAAPADEEVAA